MIRRHGEKIISLAAIAGALLLLKIITPVSVTGYDGGFYAAMTRELISSNPRTTTAPYIYRILPCWALHFVPLPPGTSFALYNTIAIALGACLLFDLFRRIGFSSCLAGMGVFFYLFSWVNVRFSFYNPIHIDPTYYLILILAFTALIRGKDGLFLIALCLGAITREYFLSLVPVYYFYRKAPGRIRDKNIFLKTIRIAALPVLIFISLRLFIPTSNHDFNYLRHGIYFARMFFIYWPRMIHSYFNICGMAAVIIVLHLPTALRCLRRHSYLSVYLLGCLTFLIVGGADRCRINFISFPAILILTLQVMKEHPRIYRNKLIIGFLVISQLYLMRVFSPLVPANYRQIWWSNISFCPEAVFRQSSLRYLIFALAFFILTLFIRLRSRTRPGMPAG